jgi:hypothetical protein
MCFFLYSNPLQLVSHSIGVARGELGDGRCAGVAVTGGKRAVRLGARWLRQLDGSDDGR